jgi:serine protease Do
MKHHPARSTVRFLAIALCLNLIVPVAALAQESAFRSDYLKTSPNFKKAFRQVISAARQSTVTILDEKKAVALGTVVAPDGLILTKASELGSDPVVKLRDGKEFKAMVVGKHKDHDLALLKIDAANLTPIQWRPSGEVPVGHWAVSVGTGEDPIALGVVSVALRKIKASSLFPPLPSLQTGYLGVSLSPADAGAKIEQVLPDSGASRAGLKAADIIMSISGKATKDAEGVRKALAGLKPNAEVQLRIRRGEKELDVTARLGKRPMSRGEIQNQMGSKLSTRVDGFPVILQHDSIVLPDQCGGPLVDLDGRAIGVNISRAGRTESYAIPSEIILPLLDEMRSGKHHVIQK